MAGQYHTAPIPENSPLGGHDGLRRAEEQE